MKNLIQVTCKNRLIAFIIKADFKAKGVKFLTPDKFHQQLIYMNRPKGDLISPHMHPPFAKQIRFTQEVLFIRSGKMKIDFYDGKKNYLESRIAGQGDVVFLAFGGHGFEFMEDTQIIEVKQGPFLKGVGPIKFEAVRKGKIRLKR